LPAVGLTGVQDATGTLLVLFVAQVVVVQLFAAVATDAVHEATTMLLVLTGVQVVVV
jgi:hypothetical protein